MVYQYISEMSITARPLVSHFSVHITKQFIAEVTIAFAENLFLYCIGLKLNWVLTINKLHSPPSRKLKSHDKFLVGKPREWLGVTYHVRSHNVVYLFAIRHKRTHPA